MNCSRSQKIIVVHDIIAKEIFNYNWPEYLIKVTPKEYKKYMRDFSDIYKAKKKKLSRNHGGPKRKIWNYVIQLLLIKYNDKIK